MTLGVAFGLALAVGPALAWEVPDRGTRLPLPAIRAVPDPGVGGRFVDADGREVLLRGVNVNAMAEYWAYGSFPTVFPFDRRDAARIAGIGWNAVRLLVSWSRVEPEPGRYDERYLRTVERLVRRLAKHGLYTIVDLHQDAWGASLAASPGTVCPPPSQPAFGWDGAPAWATLDGGALRCFTALREINPAVQAAWSAFLDDAPGPGGVGLRTRYIAMLRHLARRFAHLPGVAGYDIGNEPNALTPAQFEALAAWYAEAVRAMREGEADARREKRAAFEHVILFEPSILWSDLALGNPPPFSHDGNVAFAPHIYAGGLVGGRLQTEGFARARADAAVHGGTPVFVGEWGTDPRRAADPTDDFIRRHQALQDEFRFSATLWTWRESCGDPHKAGDVRAGFVPYVWGLFEVDCTSNQVTGGRWPLVDQLTRGWVRAAPGHLVAMRWDPVQGVLSASGGSARRGQEMVAYWPALRYGSPAVTQVEGLRRVRVRPAWGGAFVVARARGGDWALRVERGSGPIGRGLEPYAACEERPGPAMRAPWSSTASM